MKGMSTPAGILKYVPHIFFQIHLASCNFKLISCSNENCEMKVSRKDLEEHATKKCQWRTVDCDHCHELYPECQMEVIKPAAVSEH